MGQKAFWRGRLKPLSATAQGRYPGISLKPGIGHQETNQAGYKLLLLAGRLKFPGRS